MTNASRWIWGNPAARPDEYCAFAVPFTAAPGQDARLRLSCDSEYALYLNGNLISFGQYADYPDYKVFDEIDLSGSLTGGENALEIHVWYTGVDTQTYIKKPAGLRFELLLDGVIACVSDETTPSRPIAQYIAHNPRLITLQLGLTFAYDSCAADAEWGRSFPVDGLPERLFPRPVKKLILSERIPMRIIRHGGFTWQGGDTPAQRMQNALFTAHPGQDGFYAIVDSGEETTGFLDMEIDAIDDCDVTIGWGEHLIDGRCRTAVREFSCTYRAKAGRNRYLNPFRRFGCRYIQIFVEGPGARIDYLGIRPTLYPLAPSAWQPDDPLRRRIWQTCLRTLQLCMHEHYEDCPWREQALYTLDSRNQMLCGYYAFGETQFPRASLELISHGLRPDGLLSLCYPAGLDFPIPSFSLAYFLQMREYLDHSGDRDFLREKYPFLRRLMQRFLSQPHEHGLIENFYGEGGYWNFYEWSDGLSGTFNTVSRSIEAPLNAYLSLALQNLAAVADALCLPQDAAEWRAEAAKLNAALADFFFDPEIRLFRSFDDRDHDKFSVLTNSLCLLCGAADGVDRSVMLRILSNNGPADTGLTVIPNTLSMNCFRFDALLRTDRARYAPVILREIDRVYGAMLDAGATTFWETALGAADFGGAGSLCHGWSALPVYYYSLLLR